MKSLKIVIVIALLLLVFNTSNCQVYQQYLPYGYTVKARVARVIDGDTFVISDSQHVRLLGVDTPELARLNKPAQPFADSAKYLTQSLINGKMVKLTFDGKTYDIFGRILAYVWLTNVNGKDSVFIQAELLKRGYARIRYYPKKMRYYAIFYNLRRTAMRNNLGIWNK